MRTVCGVALLFAAALGCGGPDPLALRPGDTLVPVVHTGREWPAGAGGMISVGLQVEGGGRTAATAIPADRFPPGTVVAAEVRFTGPAGEPLGPPTHPPFAPDC